MNRRKLNTVERLIHVTRENGEVTEVVEEEVLRGVIDLVIDGQSVPCSELRIEQVIWQKGASDGLPSKRF